jgi:hypothetical protein
MMMRQLTFLIILVGMLIGLASLPATAKESVVINPLESNLGQIELVTRAAYRKLHSVDRGDISRLGNVMMTNSVTVKIGSPPFEITNMIYLQYLFSIGCTQYVECNLRDYDLSSEGEYIFMAIARRVGKFEYLPLLVRHGVEGGTELRLELTTDDSVLEIAASGNGEVVAWVNRKQNNPTEEIYWYEQDAPILVTKGYDGSPANGHSGNPSLSTDGHLIVFYSWANNLVPNDNGGRDVFLYHRATNKIHRISIGMNGVSPNGDSYEPFIDPTGRYVAFVSEASNLVPNDTNGHADIFLYDHITTEIRRVSLASDGSEANGASIQPSIADHGKAIAFISSATNLVNNDTNNANDVFVHYPLTNQTRRASVSTTGVEGDGATYSAQISADGGYVLFNTVASLEEGDTGGHDLYVNAPSRHTYRVNYEPLSITPDSSSGLIQNALSFDSRYIIFRSRADNLLANPIPEQGDISYYTYLYDRQTKRTERMTLPNGRVWGASTDGRYIFLTSSAELYDEIKRYNRQTAETEIVNSRSDGTIVAVEDVTTVSSRNGRYVVISAQAPEWMEGATDNCPNPNFCTLVYIKDMETGEVMHVTVASDGTPANQGVISDAIAVSDSGTWVAFISDADNLVPNDTNFRRDLFIHNTLTGETRTVSISDTGVESNNDTFAPLSFSKDEQYLVFSSNADNLVANDPNGDQNDSFIYDITTGSLDIVLLTEDGTITDTGSGGGIISGDGNTIAFPTTARLLPGDTDEESDLYLRNLLTGEQWLATIPYGTPHSEPAGIGNFPSLSDDGTIVAFAGNHLTWLDPNSNSDVYIFDRAAPPLNHKSFLPLMRYQ